MDRDDKLDGGKGGKVCDLERESCGGGIDGDNGRDGGGGGEIIGDKEG